MGFTGGASAGAVLGCGSDGCPNDGAEPDVELAEACLERSRPCWCSRTTHPHDELLDRHGVAGGQQCLDHVHGFQPGDESEDGPVLHIV